LGDSSPIEVLRRLRAAGQASFETTAPGWGAFDAAKLREHRHVAVDAATGEQQAARSLLSSGGTGDGMILSYPDRLTYLDASRIIDASRYVNGRSAG
jgi:hypothetical protein